MTRYTLTSNTEMARLLKRVADALAGYDHLPTLGSIYVSSYDGGVDLRPGLFGARLRDLAEWAAEFDAPVVIDLSDTGRVFTAIQLGGVDARVSVSITHRQAYELGAVLSVRVEAGGQVQVPAAGFFSVLRRESGEIAA